MRIAVVGGTGGFGLSICRLLMEDGHDVVAIARDPGRGAEARLRLPGLRFTAMDRSEITASALEKLQADMVVDAAGPFQGLPTTLAEHAIDAGAHYVDIADDRDFVRRIRRLDEDARHRHVVIVTGASSVPALSSAVAAELAHDLDVVDRVDVTITASSQAAFGRSVLVSMLSGAGADIRHRDGPDGTGMMEHRRVSFSAGGHDLVRGALSCDVPDHDEMAPLLPGSPVVRFRAGGERDLQNIAMWLVALARRAGLLRDARALASAAGVVRRIQRRSDGRSGMKVEVRGRSGDEPVVHEWTLVATQGHGPMIPCLVVPRIVEAVEKGEMLPGARSAAGTVSSSSVLVRMPQDCLVAETRTHRPVPLYARIMGERFYRLAPAVRRMHDDPWVCTARGRASVERSDSLIARLICRLAGFPPASAGVAVTVTFERMGEEERWTRQFGRHRFASCLSQDGRFLVERFGPLAFRFDLTVRGGTLSMEHAGWTAFGIRMPHWIGPSGTATESGDEGLFVFDVPVRVPLLGQIIRYRGWLQPDRTAE